MILAVALCAGPCDALGELTDSAPAFIAPDQSPYVATEGKVALVWEFTDSGDSVRYELQQSDTADFANPRSRYAGMDRATYVSGLPAGDFYFRVRSLTSDDQLGAWSDTLQVSVEYVSSGLVFWLVGTGLVVFAATVLTVLIGHNRTSRRETLTS